MADAPSYNLWDLINGGRKDPVTDTPSNFLWRCRADHQAEKCFCIPTEQELPTSAFTCYNLFRLIEAGRRKFTPSIQLLHRFSFTEHSEKIEWGTREFPDMIEVVHTGAENRAWKLTIRDQSGKTSYFTTYERQEVTNLSIIILTNLLRFYAHRWINTSYDCL